MNSDQTLMIHIISVEQNGRKFKKNSIYFEYKYFLLTYKFLS